MGKQTGDAMNDILSEAIERIIQLKDDFTVFDFVDAIKAAGRGFLTVELNTRRGRASKAISDILSEAIERIGQLEDDFTVVDLADTIEAAAHGLLIVELSAESTGAWDSIPKVSEINKGVS